MFALLWLAAFLVAVYGKIVMFGAEIPMSVLLAILVVIGGIRLLLRNEFEN